MLSLSPVFQPKPISEIRRLHELLNDKESWQLLRGMAIASLCSCSKNANLFSALEEFSVPG